MTVSLKPMYTRGCVLMCFFSLSHKEHSHPSSALSNGGSERLTLGPLIRPHLLGILLQARHSSCNMERNPDYLPPPATFATASLFLFLSPRSSFSLRLTQINTHTDTHTHLLSMSASQLSHRYHRTRQNEDKLI